MTANRLGLWIALGALVAACGSGSSGNFFGGDDGGPDATSGDGSGGSSGSSSGSGGSSGSSSGSSSGGSSGAGSSSGTGSSSGSSSGSGGSSGSSSGSSSGGSSGSSSGGPSDAGADAPDCGSIPTLHVDPAGTIYCGYGADSGKLDCLEGAGDGVCCLGGAIGGGQFAPEICASSAAGCTNGGDGGTGQSAAIPIACYQVGDCTTAGFTGAVACCLQGATGPSTVPGCTYPKATKGTAVVCEGTPGDDGGTDAAAATTTGTCATGEVQICSAQADCPTGKTCTPGKWKIFQVGFCL